MTSYLAQVAAELRGRLDQLDAQDTEGDAADGGLPSVEMLLAERDAAAGVIRGGRAGAQLPGNVAAMMLALDVHEFVRRLEASLRLAVTGKPGPARGGSDANTRAALKAIVNLGEAVSEDAAGQAGRLLEKFVTAIGQLPAIDEAPRWERIRPGPGGLPPACPNCGTFSLRVALASGAVMCVCPGCRDGDGNSPPVARLELSRISGDPILVWRDGVVQHSPAAPSAGSGGSGDAQE